MNGTHTYATERRRLDDAESAVRTMQRYIRCVLKQEAGTDADERGRLDIARRLYETRLRAMGRWPGDFKAKAA
jgi:hypothetical protein